ncbi:MAG TPA: L-aspartate oxidase [Gemmataceae bacterium]|nr:L-aspartate oxidase [Gemmataceae bacterium]
MPGHDFLVRDAAQGGSRGLLRSCFLTMTFPHRYLVQFGPKQTPHLFTDILVIGAGIAGLRAALEVPPDFQVLVVTKDSIQQSNSSFAQGGIAGVLSPEDRFENHIEDTLTAGAGLCDRPVVEMVVREAPAQINDLIRWGTRFDEEGGQLALTREGGHSHRRIVHALGDATGHEVMRAIIERALQTPNITVWDNTFTIDLLTHEGRCVGALVWRPGRDQLLIWAKQTILASGGAGMVYRETTNPPVATGDGMAAAYRAGAELRDMEFMQFHPTVLYVAGSGRFLISEAVRGEGAYLRDKNGIRFMPEEDPRAELAPRDIVSQAIVRRMERTQHPSVYLDLSHLDPKLVLQRFPGIARVCRSFGLDITRDLIPVRPGAHYMIGGVTVDLEGRTTLPGLWAAGEVTSSGLHGANRLASNSLLEGLVYGARCGRGAAAEAARMPDTFTIPPIQCRFEPGPADTLDVADVTNALRSLMVREMGVMRDEAGLREAERTVAFWCRYALAREFSSRAGWELQNMLTVARLMIGSALARQESRGVHFRTDFPRRDDANWQRHLICPPFPQAVSV